MNYRKPALTIAIGLILIVLGLNLHNQEEAHDEIAVEIGNNISRELLDVDREAAELLADDPDSWNNLNNSFFIMDSISVLRWNKNDFVPDVRTVQDDFSIRLLRWPRGIFLLRKWPMNNDKFLLAVITLQNRYKINNRYLVSGWNKNIFPTQELSINDGTADGYPFAWNGTIVFRLKLAEPVLAARGTNNLEYVLITLGILLWIAGFCLWMKGLHLQMNHGKVFLLLCVFFVGGRALMLYFFSSPDWPLFDPSFFASSGYNRSIGDLLLNMLAISVPIGYLFYNYYRIPFFKSVLATRGKMRLVASIVALLACFYCILFPFLFFETISHNSSISLDVTQRLEFDYLRTFSFLSIILGSVSGFALTHIFLRLLLSLTGRSAKVFFTRLLVATLLFFVISILIERSYAISMAVSVGYLSVTWALNLPKYLWRTSYTTFIYLFVAMVALAMQGSLAIRKFVVEDKISSQVRFANAFLTDRDYLGEYLLNESVQRISGDPFIQTRLGSPFLSKAVVRQKVKQVYLNSYFDKYDIRVYLFNASGNSYDNSTSLSFSETSTDFQRGANNTNFEGIFFLKNSTPESTKRYLAVVPISRFGLVTGYVVLDLSLKRVIPRNVFPELLLDDRFIQYFKNRDFSYAFYVDNVIGNSFGDFNYEKNLTSADLEDRNLFEAGLNKGGFLHVGVKDDQENITLVSSPAYRWFDVITNFSFLFTIGLFIMLSGLLFYGVMTLYYRKQINYSARIQLYVYLAFILPLVLVSATTIGLISQSAENQLKVDYVDKSRIIAERLAPLVDNYQKNPDVSLSDLENQVIELTKLANIDASVFLPSGKLLTSSQPLIYEDRILSALIDRRAYQAIIENDEQSFVNNERIGLLTYNCAYYALRSAESASLMGVLSVPFFESAYSLEKTQINVVANIVTIFSIVFILFSIVSFFAVRWLTFPLEFITRTLRRTTLSASNKPLVWRANDEIGMMVNEYNKMVENLEQSKVELSRIQKESAWREIAKQVAHEVKNPLTPMKLTLQQMEHALLTDSLSKERTTKSLNTLLQQVEILNEIAASFSAFARMPAPILQRIDVAALVKRVVDLHGDYREGTVTVNKLVKPIYVMGDDQLLSRVFSNIVLNALQSREDDKKIEVKVTVSQADNTCRISFADNGKGIDPAIGEKIFLPHFSTKKSGSGLGLAIAKQGIEQNGGTIHFESQIGAGTVFHIEIPTIG